MLTVASNAQTFDDIIASRRYVNCQDVAFNASTIISGLYDRYQIDSIYQFLDYWDNKCGPAESTFRIRTILDIRTGKFSADSIAAGWIENLVDYKGRLEYMQQWMRLPRSREPGNLFAELYELDSLSRRMASETLSDDLDERLLLEFYSVASPTFANISDAPPTSRLGAFYHEKYIETYRRPLTHIGIVGGLVQNYGRISVFGNRPHVGLVMGGKWLRHNVDLLLDFRLGPSKEQYSFVYNDSLITGDSWTGMYVGLEYTFDFIHSPKVDVGISPGIAYDRVTALTAENDYGEDPLFLGSFNKNVGLVIKYKFGKNGGYVGWHLRYNWVDYKNPGGTPLEGHYLNVRLTIGSLWDYWRQSRLESLE